MPNRNTDSTDKSDVKPEKPRGDNAASKKDLNGEAKAGAKKWDIIDENAWESFPASDPPASWAGRDIAPQDRDDAGSDDKKKD